MRKDRDFIKPAVRDAMIGLAALLVAVGALLAFLLYNAPSAKKAMEHRQQQMEEILKY